MRDRDPLKNRSGKSGRKVTVGEQRKDRETPVVGKHKYTHFVHKELPPREIKVGFHCCFQSQPCLFWVNVI